MAREVIIRMTDDLDRTQEADESIEFTFENVTYVLDLTTKHGEEFREALEPWMTAAHERVKVKRNAPKAPDGETRKARQRIRRWAQRQGMHVSDHGIISREVRDAFAAAHGEAKSLETPAETTPEKQPAKRVPWNALPEEVPNSNGISRAMRDWARENGHNIRRGGYVTADVQRLYHEAMDHHPAGGRQLIMNGETQA